MINLYTTELIINTVALIIAYLITESLSGFFSAWITKKFGDSTAEHLGFLTLNPFIRIDPIGFCALIFLGLGWGVYIPINYHSIQAPYRVLKIIMAYFAESIAHLTIVLIALTCLIKMLTIQALYVIGPMIISGSISLSMFTTTYGHASSLYLVMAIVLVSISYLGLMLGVLNLIINSIRLIALFIFDEDPASANPLITFMPLLIFLLFAHHIRLYILYCLAHAGHFLAALLGN